MSVCLSVRRKYDFITVRFKLGGKINHNITNYTILSDQNLSTRTQDLFCIRCDQFALGDIHFRAVIKRSKTVNKVRGSFQPKERTLREAEFLATM